MYIQFIQWAHFNIHFRIRWRQKNGFRSTLCSDQRLFIYLFVDNGFLLVYCTGFHLNIVMCALSYVEEVREKEMLENTFSCMHLSQLHEICERSTDNTNQQFNVLFWMTFLFHFHLFQISYCGYFSHNFFLWWRLRLNGDKYGFACRFFQYKPSQTILIRCWLPFTLLSWMFFWHSFG